MTVNVGTIDRLLRAALGVALLLLAFVSSLPLFDGGFVKYAAALIGVVMIVTAAIRMCPIYSIFGIKTCRM
ncbi:YgaP family membrane protein [Sulfitobacter sp.]|uniref:YgaP family membrane protein n=1 Tax=Sulfitobacter sp. TaxID=1903071 RepID=UPI0030013B4C